MWSRIKALLVRQAMPRCPTCGALVETRGEFCSDECDREAARRQALGF